MTRIAIFNQKGGVGKTTSSLNLSAAYARDGRVVAMFDLDPQAHLTHIYRNKVNEKRLQLFLFYEQDASLSELLAVVNSNLYLLPANAELVKVDSIYGKGPTILKKLGLGITTLEQTIPNLVSFLDCCPYIGVISLSAIFAADVVIIPVASDYFSVSSAVKVSKALNALEPVVKKRIERRYLLTRADRRKKMTTEVDLELRRLFGDEVLQTRISENIALAESPHVGKSVFEYDATTVGAHDYLALLEELKAAGFY